MGARMPPGRYAIRTVQGTSGLRFQATTAREQLLAASASIEVGLGELEGALLRMGSQGGSQTPELHEAIGHIVDALRLVSSVYWQVERAPPPRSPEETWPYRGRSRRLS